MKIMLLAACLENNTFVDNKGVMLTNFLRLGSEINGQRLVVYRFTGYR